MVYTTVDQSLQDEREDAKTKIPGGACVNAWITDRLI